MVLELAVAAGCDAIVTHNIRDFHGAEELGVRVLTPKQFLQELAERASRGSRKKFEAVLAKVPDVVPDESDRIPGRQSKTGRKHTR